MNITAINFVKFSAVEKHYTAIHDLSSSNNTKKGNSFDLYGGCSIVISKLLPKQLYFIGFL